MPTGQQYATNVPQTFIPNQVGPAVTNFPVNSLTGWPTPPFTAVFEIGTSLQEAIDVISVSGNTITNCTRGIDGTTALTHNPNATLTHADIGRDFREPRAHIDSSGPTDSQSHAVHGLTIASSVVMGTKEVQTVSSKTMDSTNTWNSGPINSSTITTATFSGAQAMGSGAWTGTGSLAENTLQFNGITGAVGNTRLAGQTSGGPPTSGTFVTGDVVYDAANIGFWTCTAGGSPGTWQAASGKYLISSVSPSGVSSVTFSSIPQYFTHLRVEYVGRTGNGAGSGVDNMLMQLNGVVSNTYAYEYNGWSGANAAYTAAVNTTSSMACGVVWTSVSATVGSGRGFIDLPYYTETTFMKQIEHQSHAGNGTSTAVHTTGGGSASAVTAAITSINIAVAAGSFLTGSKFNLYGLV